MARPAVGARMGPRGGDEEVGVDGLVQQRVDGV